MPDRTFFLNIPNFATYTPIWGMPELAALGPHGRRRRGLVMG